MKGILEGRFDVLRIDRVEYRQWMGRMCRIRWIENRKADRFEKESPVSIVIESFEPDMINLAGLSSKARLPPEEITKPLHLFLLLKHGYLGQFEEKTHRNRRPSNNHSSQRDVRQEGTFSNLLGNVEVLMCGWRRRGLGYR
jgi:hypothetical protein